MITIESPAEALNLSFEELYNQILLLKEEGEITEKEHEKIKNGIKIKFPIYYIIQEWYEIYPSSKKAKILGYGKIPLDAFMEEKEQRETLMRKIVIDNLEESPTAPRI